MGYLPAEWTKLSTKRVPIQTSKPEMNISNSESLMRDFWSDLDYSFVSEITRRGTLRVISSYGGTTSICASNLITFPVFPQIQVHLRVNQS